MGRRRKAAFVQNEVRHRAALPRDGYHNGCDFTGTALATGFQE